MSSSASSSDPTASTNLASFYKCPVCFEYIQPPILQCANGHMVCSNCSPKLDQCPLCQGPIGTCRNLFMEKAISEIKFPCKYSAQGCQVTMLLAEKSKHEENCEFLPITYSCPFQAADCKWKGLMDQIVPHIRSKHSLINITQGAKFLFRLGVDFFHISGILRANVQCCHGHHFIMMFKKERKKSDDGLEYDRICSAVQMIGTESEANKFSYSLRVSGHRHHMTWKDTPLSVTDNLDSAATKHECLVFGSTDIEKKFSQNSGLEVEVKIERYSE